MPDYAHDRNPTRHSPAARLDHGSQLSLHDAAPAHAGYFRCGIYDLDGAWDGTDIWPMV